MLSCRQRSSLCSLEGLSKGRKHRALRVLFSGTLSAGALAGATGRFKPFLGTRGKASAVLSFYHRSFLTISMSHLHPHQVQHGKNSYLVEPEDGAYCCFAFLNASFEKGIVHIEYTILNHTRRL